MWNVQLFQLDYDDREMTAVKEVIESRWLSMGEKTCMFERAFSDFIGENVEATAVSSGTAALHLALLALGIKDGDEVIVPALTFVADANAVKLVGATPIAADCASFDNWNLSPETIKKCITEKTKAVIVVHFAGYPCDMIAIKQFCDSHGLKLIEDVAHAPGARVANRNAGSWGDIGCFSFFSNKNIAVGEGGMVTTSNHDLHEKIRYLRSHGMTSLTIDRHKGRSISYDVTMPGLNYRIDELRAALGLVQLTKVEKGNLKRKSLSQRYRENLNFSSVKIPFSHELEGYESAYHIMPSLLPVSLDRLEVIESLKSCGLQTSIHYPSWEKFSAYKGSSDMNRNYIAHEIAARELTLPLYPTMEESDVDRVCNALLKAADNKG